MAMGTHSVDQINAINQAHANAAQVFIAAPVLGRPDLAATGQLSIVPAGPADVVDKMQPLYDAMSKQTFRAGEQPQSSTAVKIANNFMLGSAIENMGEAFSLVRKLGVKPELFFEVMMKGTVRLTRFSDLRSDDRRAKMGKPRGHGRHWTKGRRFGRRCCKVGGNVGSQRTYLARTPAKGH